MGTRQLPLFLSSGSSFSCSGFMVSFYTLTHRAIDSIHEMALPPMDGNFTCAVNGSAKKQAPRWFICREQPAYFIRTHSFSVCVSALCPCIHVIYLNCPECILEQLAKVKESSNDRKNGLFSPCPFPLSLMLTDEECRQGPTI